MTISTVLANRKFWFLLAFWGLMASQTACEAAGVKNSTPGALSFRVQAQFSYRGNGEDAMPGDALDAKIVAQGQRARVETKVGERPLVVLISPPHLYKLLPRSKTGTRYPLTKAGKNPGLSSLDPQPWLRSPSTIRATLKNQGAKRIGTSKMNGQAVEVWSASKFMGQTGQVKAILRLSDALPVRVEIKSPQLTATVNWRDYQKIKALPALRFQPPAGYRIREAED
jgi:hypothetical protein